MIRLAFQPGHLVAAGRVDWSRWDWRQGGQEEAAPKS